MGVYKIPGGKPKSTARSGPGCRCAGPWEINRRSFGAKFLVLLRAAPGIRIDQNSPTVARPRQISFSSIPFTSSSVMSRYLIVMRGFEWLIRLAGTVLGALDIAKGLAQGVSAVVFIQVDRPAPGFDPDNSWNGLHLFPQIFSQVFIGFGGVVDKPVHQKNLDAE